MAIFTLKEINKGETTNKIFELVRNGVCLVDEFIDMAKVGGLEPFVHDLFVTIRYFANGNQPPLRDNKLKKVKGQPNAWEARKSVLRLYLTMENKTGVIIIIGGTKNTQPGDLLRLEQIIKEYSHDR